jgi:hypothetical protein
MSRSYYVGLDLGQMRDFTALAVVERDYEAKRQPSVLLSCAYLHRFALGTSYVTIVEDVVRLVQQPNLKPVELVIDQTGVGKPVCDLFERANLGCSLERVVITCGQKVSKGEDGSLHIAKLALISNLQILLQTRTLKIDARLPDAAVLAKELSTYQVKVTASLNETFNADRDSDHDDLVIALALACWKAKLGDPWEGWEPTVVHEEDLPWALRQKDLGWDKPAPDWRNIQW